uniref:Protein kinase domain-containing protein n=1 Tax=Strix occidentalis caurina TaxID=311401 RepID=A0A8D0EZP9_STROC
MGTLVVGAECYDLVATVGKGTFGEVAQGRRRSTGEVVAIKILKKKRYHGRVVKKELKLLQALRGVDTEESHIVRFLESFADGACTYLVFELLEQNLRDFQKKNNFLPLPVRHIRTITVQLLAALLKLKELSTIHADLKPENIMLVDHARYPFHVKLVDFGSACTLTEACHIKQPYIQTRFYRAPEILLGLPFCEKVDVWSLGCVMAELHLGWPLYPGINEYDQVRYICSTLGLPRGELLCAGWKTCSFFQRVPHPTGSWQLRAPGEEMVKITLNSAQPEPAVPQWPVARCLPGAAEALPLLSVADVSAVAGAPIPLKNRLQLLPDGAGRRDGGGAGTAGAQRLVHHQRRSRRPREVVAGPVGRPCKEMWGQGDTHTPPKTRPQQQPATIRTRGRRAHRYTPPSPSPCTCCGSPGPAAGSEETVTQHPPNRRPPARRAQAAILTTATL